jgi:hypothetical protein
MKVHFFIGKDVLHSTTFLKTINTDAIPQIKEKVFIDDMLYVVNDIMTVYDLAEQIEIAVEEYSE